MDQKKDYTGTIKRPYLKGKEMFFANLNLSPQPIVCLTKLNIPEHKKNNFVINVNSKQFKQLLSPITNQSKSKVKTSKIVKPKIRYNKNQFSESKYDPLLSKETKSHGRINVIKSESTRENDRMPFIDESYTTNNKLEGPFQTGDKENDWTLELSEEDTNEATNDEGNQTDSITRTDINIDTTRTDRNIDTFLTVLRKSTDDNTILSALERSYLCELCQQGFLKKNHLRKHMRLCMGIKKTKKKKKESHGGFTCPMCIKTYDKKESLDKHNANIHNLKRLYKCLVCSQHFYNEEALILHCRSRHGLGGSDIYKCPYCEASFNLRNDLNYHCRKAHKTNQYYVCEMCLECFKSYETCELHVQGHGFCCEICMFKTKSESVMAEHKWTHLYMVVHKCGRCERTFKAKRDFTKHMKVHEKEKKV